MGHDITAYILPPKQSPECTKEYTVDDVIEASYFRIGAFNTDRNRAFYGTLPKASPANAGVSGNGDEIIFTIDEIKRALAVATRFTKFDEMLTAVQQVDSWDEELPELQQERQACPIYVDICKFHQDIIDAYDKYVGECQIVICFY